MIKILIARLLDTIRINRSWKVEETQIFKERKAYTDGLVFWGNLFLKWSRSRIRMFESVNRWKEWELESFSLLHGKDSCHDEGERVIGLQVLPGRPIKELLKQNRASEDVFVAVAHEFSRAHQLRSGLLEGAWSHGDPHLDNVLYDEASNKAFLIDFETRHENGMTLIERHADDLLVFLLDLMGHTVAEELEKYSEIFLNNYSHPNKEEVLSELKNRLHAPRGWEKVLWLTRTNYLPTFY